MRIRFQFNRTEELKFIGHLDILRLFERAFKRSGLPVAHSQGFNPRPQIVFGQPMPLGLTSEGEFADVELMECLIPEAFIKKMNDSLPPGIQLIDVREKKAATKLMSLIGAARYRIGFIAPEVFDIQAAVKEILSLREIPAVKKTKSGDKQINIRPFIYALSGEINEKTGLFEALLGAGQDDNIRPELFLAGVSAALGVNLEMRGMHRYMLYGRVGDKWVSLMDEKLL